MKMLLTKEDLTPHTQLLLVHPSGAIAREFETASELEVEKAEDEENKSAAE